LIAGASGFGFTTTFVLVGLLTRPFTIAITEYCPAKVGSELGMLMDGVQEENPFGPVQKDCAFPGVVATNEIGDPSQTTEFPATIGGAGIVFTISELLAPVVVIIYTGLSVPGIQNVIATSVFPLTEMGVPNGAGDPQSTW